MNEYLLLFGNFLHGICSLTLQSLQSFEYKIISTRNTVFMGITQTPSGAHRAFQPRNAGSRIVTSGGRHRAHHHQRIHTAAAQRPMERRRTSAGKVNTFMPRQPSLAFRSQVVRRKVWMLEAKKQGLRPERASKLSSIVLKLKKKIKYMNRQQHRGEFRDSLRRVFRSK